jgi:hypothetical protein
MVAKDAATAAKELLLAASKKSVEATVREAPPKPGEVARVYFTDAQINAQMVALLQGQLAQLQRDRDNEVQQLQRENENLKHDAKRNMESIRALQAQLLASQDRVVELQGKLLAARAAVM